MQSCSKLLSWKISNLKGGNERRDESAQVFETRVSNEERIERAPVDIENSDDVVVPDLRLHGDVDSIDNPLEESLVYRRGVNQSASFVAVKRNENRKLTDRLGQSISSGSSLRNVERHIVDRSW